MDRVIIFKEPDDSWTCYENDNPMHVARGVSPEVALYNFMSKPVTPCGKKDDMGFAMCIDANMPKAVTTDNRACVAPIQTIDNTVTEIENRTDRISSLVEEVICRLFGSAGVEPCPEHVSTIVGKLDGINRTLVHTVSNLETLISLL